jgi:hypothetical protein
MSARPRLPTPNFGGWHDYQMWADHDFRPKGPQDDPKPDEDVSEEPVEEIEDDEPDEDAFEDEGPDTVEWPSAVDAQEHGSDALPEEDTALLVRPYARTGGRTQGSYKLALETLVSVTDFGRSTTTLTGDHRLISQLCAHPVSVSEIAAGLRVPINVAQVLISDMADDSLVIIHRNEPTSGDKPSVAFMERVLAGLRAL